ncbi:MAG: aconitate hydratase AcnA [Candidatus Pacebacteria bacterium]|nr:aconitate hydratase AcnA [Candidatus Paceibacterota bacterium]
MKNKNSFGSRKTMTVAGKDYSFFSLAALSDRGFKSVETLPNSLKVLLENLLRFEDDRSVTAAHITALANWQPNSSLETEIAFRPARVLMQDFTGVPAVVDLAAMRDAMVKMGGDPNRVNPLSQVDLVIDHSVMVDYAGTATAFGQNVDLEFERNGERYEFLHWGQSAFNRFRVVPPDTGICHQVNMEYLAQVVWSDPTAAPESDGSILAYPDSLVGTDSHTTMVNGLAVLGWGVGGIEAEAAMLGQPVSMLIPEVVGMRLNGALRPGVTATDLVLTVTETLRKAGVVGKFVEFFGAGLKTLALTDRATIANMAPEYGATCGYFPIDEETLRYLRFTGRDEDRIQLVEAYAKAQGLWRDESSPEPRFSTVIEFDLNAVVPSLAGPKRPQDRVALPAIAASMTKFLAESQITTPRRSPVANRDFSLGDGDVVIAAITSCTNTSNPSVMMAAGLVAKKAVELGLRSKPWVKTSLAPGSLVVTDYLTASNLQSYLDQLGFNTVGYGCTTCIGNSGPLESNIESTISQNDLNVAAVLSGNRNFEGRISPLVKANYLASPPLVVAFALAGTVLIDLDQEPLGTGKNGQPVYLRDIWPSAEELSKVLSQFLTRDSFIRRYSDVFTGPKQWQEFQSKKTTTYGWKMNSSYVQHPPYFDGMKRDPEPVKDIIAARCLAIFGDSITTDHISPAGSISKNSPAALYLQSLQVAAKDFNSYGARRGNDSVMVRGTFANIRIKNEMLPETTGGVTKHIPSGEIMSIYDAAVKYQATRTPLIVFAGKEYGTGSSRDWAAKGTLLLGVKAVIVESFERIHRSNLVGMGVLPLYLPTGVTRKTLGIKGDETFDITGMEAGLVPRMAVTLTIHRADGRVDQLPLLCRIDTLDEVEYFRHGGILPFMVRQLMAA